MKQTDTSFIQTVDGSKSMLLKSQSCGRAGCCYLVWIQKIFIVPERQFDFQQKSPQASCITLTTNTKTNSITFSFNKQVPGITSILCSKMRHSIGVLWSCAMATRNPRQLSSICHLHILQKLTISANYIKLKSSLYCFKSLKC